MTSDLIYNYTKRIETIKRGLASSGNGQAASRFLDALSDHGLSKGRVVYYGCRLPRILQWFDKTKIPLGDLTRDDCKEALRNITGDQYAGKTNRAYAETLKRLVHFAKAEEIGEKRDGKDYVEEVSWIRPENFVKLGRKREIKPGDLLTVEEIESLINAISIVSRFSIRDRAMVLCMYEGAFRPGELLNMTVGGVLFKDKIAVISTTGKTGEKTIPMLLSYRPLLEWISQHPYKDDLDAPLWWSFQTKKILGYGYLRKLVKSAAKKAGIKKKVWNYLFRHTKLTDVARKHPDQILKKFGNWKKGTDMMDVYVHLSESDLEEAVLKEHGLLKQESVRELTLKTCPRCSEQNTIGVKRCVKCGYVIDEQVAIKMAQREASGQDKETLIENYAKDVADLKKDYNELKEMLVKVLKEKSGS
ncbi:MAG: tyrosine-type recombinase/integrase [Nitrosotalea sp.]